MAQITLLSAAIPLVKRFEMVDGVLVKHSYPNVKNFTSNVYDVANIKELYTLISEQAKAPKAPCMFKGELTAPLKNESRKSMGVPNALTSYAVLDFDDAPFTSHREAMRALGIDDVSYVWQYSSSASLGDRPTLNGHAFVLLSEPISPQLLKSWFMYANMRIDVLRNAVRLSKAKHALHYPLDVVVSDNNRIVYIGDPIFKGLEDPLKKRKESRIQLIAGKKQVLDVSRIPEHSLEALQGEARELIRSLRKAEGLPLSRAKERMVGEWSVQPGVGAATTYQVIDDGGDFIRYNINGGDSQAYWHPRTNFELLHSFKGEPSVYMREILPQRYAELCTLQQTNNDLPDEDGNMVLAFREKITGKYWKGTWNEKERQLDIHAVHARVDLEDFMQEHGRTLGTYVPEWELYFDPSDDNVVSTEARRINIFQPTPLMVRGRTEPSSRKTTFPTIQKLLDHCIGRGLIQDHFLNWLAVIIQHRCKAESAWILHGTQGTGKGLLISKVLKPIFSHGSRSYMQEVIHDAVNSQFNSWLDKNLIVFVDEIDVDTFTNSNASDSRLKNWITSPDTSLRRMRADFAGAVNYVSFIFGSNKPQPVMIPLDDRRFNCGVFQTMPIHAKKGGPLTDKEIDDLLPTEVEAFAYYLHNYEASRSRAREVLDTEDRRQIQALGITSVDEFASYLLNGQMAKMFEFMPDEKALNDHGLISQSATSYAALMKRFVQESESKISRDELRLLFEHTIGEVKGGVNKFSSFLRHHGIITRPIWKDSQTVMGITVRWRDSEDVIKQLRASIVPAEPTKLRKVK